jgi:hypothetical protein
MRGWTIGAVLAAAVGLGSCTLVGIENVDPNNTVPVFSTQQKVIDGITYTKTEYVDGSIEYTAHNAPPKGYTGAWSENPHYQGTTIYVGPKGTRRTLESKGTPPLNPLDPKLWETPQTISSPGPQQPANAPLLGPTASSLPPRSEGGGDGGGGGGDGGGGSGH